MESIHGTRRQWRAVAFAGVTFMASCCLHGNESDDGVLTGDVSIDASRVSGVAPLCVHFSASYPDEADSYGWFHDQMYTWDFGDVESGNWSTDDASRNADRGPVSAHVFERPGTYTTTVTVRDAGGTVASESVVITVSDPDVVFSGTMTTCVSASGNFSGAPSGCRTVTTSSLSTITGYAEPGNRILLRRGDSWTVAGLSGWPTNGGPVTIGAFGTGERPVITVTGGAFLGLDDKQDWRIMDLDLRDPARSNGTFGGVMNMQRILFLRIRTRGFADGLGWSHWNDSVLKTIDQMAIVECDFGDAQDNVLYVGSERLALLGTRIQDAHESHVARVWQAYLSVISHNIMSGSSMDTISGRHALKLHGPGFSEFQNYNEYGTPVPDSGLLGRRTEFVVVSDNVFGSSGPWPVIIGPQDEATDAMLSHIIFERNRVISDFGSPSAKAVQLSLYVSGRYMTIRNNIFDGTGSSSDYTAIRVAERGTEPAPLGIEVYNNTIYRRDNGSGNSRTGVEVWNSAEGTIVKNNLVSFPDPAEGLLIDLLDSESASTVSEGNLMAPTALFVAAGAVDPLLRDFHLQTSSVGINQGVTVEVFEDFDGATRPQGVYDVGAYEQ